MTSKFENPLLPCLDFFVSELQKNALSQTTGFLTGKTGTAVVLYYYARYRQNMKVTEYADHLLDRILDEISLESGFDFEKGICGTVWAIHRLVTSGFIHADENIFEDIDIELFKNPEEILRLYDFGIESWKGVYLLSRLQSADDQTKDIWQQRIKEYLLKIHQILIFRYTAYSLPVFTCRDLLPVFHVCAALWDNHRYMSEIKMLCEELPVITEVALKEERNYGDQYILHRILSQFPLFSTELPEIDNPRSVSLPDIIRFYLNRFIFEMDIQAPEIIADRLYTIVNEKKQIDDWLSLINPDNLGLENYTGGFVWAILQLCIDKKNMISLNNYMTNAELQFFKKELLSCTNYLEFGSGFSTSLAVQKININQITTVESDSYFWRELVNNDKKIEDAVKSKRLKPILVNIGLIKGWGFPVDDSLIEKYPEYSKSPFVFKANYDLVFIDGRFRVACALNACIYLPINTKILIHDFYNRPYYKILLLFLNEIQKVDSMGLFSINVNNDKNLIRKAISLYEYSPE